MHVFDFEDIAVDQYTYGEPLGSASLLIPNHSTKGADQEVKSPGAASVVWFLYTLHTVSGRELKHLTLEAKMLHIGKWLFASTDTR